MIVKCKLDINSVGKLIGLTIDKSYTITDISPIGYRIIDNELRNFWYTKDLFYSVIFTILFFASKERLEFSASTSANNSSAPAPAPAAASASAEAQEGPSQTTNALPR